MTLQIGSGRGTTELTFASGTELSTMIDAFNAVKEVTGVSAVATSTVVECYDIAQC